MVSTKKTNDYSLFTFKKINRPIDLDRHKKLLRLMREVGFLECFPIVVNPLSNGKLEIVDGQHRWACAKELNLPIYYVLGGENIEVSVLNATQVPWNMSDHVESFVKGNNQHYEGLKKFQEKTGLKTGICASLLRGSRWNGQVFRDIRDGNFIIKTSHYAEKVAMIVERISKIFPRAKNRNFVEAVGIICKLRDVNLQRLIDNIEKYTYMLQSCGTRDAILQMLENIYNFKRHGEGYPLAMNAKNYLKKQQ